MSVLTDLIYGGSHAVAGLTEGAVNDAIAKYGADHPIAFPDTAYFFPTIYAATGVIALLAGIALLFAPAKSLVFLTTVLGFYFVITAGVRLFTAIFEPLLPAGWRVTSIISNLIIILGGVIILRNQAFSTATLTTLVVVVAGFGWIVEGVMSILESELSSNRALAILSGALSIIAGVFVFIYPLWSAKMLVIFSGAALLVFGVTLIIRAIRFGKLVR